MCVLHNHEGMSLRRQIRAEAGTSAVVLKTANPQNCWVRINLQICRMCRKKLVFIVKSILAILYGVAQDENPAGAWHPPRCAISVQCPLRCCSGAEMPVEWFAPGFPSLNSRRGEWLGGSFRGTTWPQRVPRQTRVVPPPPPQAAPAILFWVGAEDDRWLELSSYIHGGEELTYSVHTFTHSLTVVVAAGREE